MDFKDLKTVIDVQEFIPVADLVNIPKGGLVTADGTPDTSVLSVGTDGLFLKADSAQALGLIWGAVSYNDLTDVPSLSIFNVPTTNLDLDSNRIINLADGIDPGDAASWGQVQSLVKGIRWRAPVVVAVPTNINISSPGTDTFDGITLSVDDRLLLTNQTTTGQNGVYIFKGSGVALERPEGENTLGNIDGNAVIVDQGTDENKIYIIQVDNTAGVLGTEPIDTIVFSTGSSDPKLASISALTIAEGDILVAADANSFTNVQIPNSSVIARDSSGNVEGVVGTAGQVLLNVAGDWSASDGLDGNTTTLQLAAGTVVPANLQEGEVFLKTDTGEAFYGDAATQVQSLIAPNKVSLERTVMTGNVTLTTTSAGYQYFDPDGVDRDVTLPNTPELGNRFVIRNLSSANQIRIMDGVTPLLTLGQSLLDDIKDGIEGIFIYDGVEWVVTLAG